MEEITALLRKAQRDLDGLHPLYKQSLAAKAISIELKLEIKSILENQRSLLDYLAREIVSRFGNQRPNAKVYYPSAPRQADFASQMNGWMPGVAESRPDIVAAIERHQKFQPDHEWMEWLWMLATENKHERLSAQTRMETWRVTAQGNSGSIDYVPYTPETGGVIFGPGVSIGGVPVNPATQRPVPHPSQTVTEIIFVDWLFADLKLSVLAVVEAIQAGVHSALDDIVQAAGL